MKADFSWTRSGAKYADLYRRLVKPAVRPTAVKNVARRS
jgi:glycogen synthase